MPQLDAVLETALYVDDLDRAVRFYTDVMELKPLYQDSRTVRVLGRRQERAADLPARRIA